jgi:transposase
MSRPTNKPNLSEEERQELKKQIRKTKERKKADQLRVILYKDAGQSNTFISQLLQMGRNQVTKILQRYGQGGVPAILQANNHQGSRPKLSLEQQQILKVELTTNIYATAHQVIAWVEHQWGVQYELSGMHKLLKRLGFSYKKNRLVPSQADPELQRQFVHWLAGLRERMGPDDLLMFSDAAHFKHNAEAGYGSSLLILIHTEQKKFPIYQVNFLKKQLTSPV